MPSNHPSSTDSDDLDTSSVFRISSISAHLAVTVAVAAKDSSNKSQKTAAKSKTKIETKNKELAFTFEGTSDNYLAFLSAILRKHGHEKYTPVVDKRRFSIKVAIPPVKTKGAAVDVDSYHDFQEIVTHILESKPQKMIIWLSLDDVKKASKRKEENSDSEDKSSSEESDSKNPKGAVERELARLRGILEKKYANPNDSGYAYVQDDGERVPLMPSMILQWARAMYSGDTTHSIPPHTQAFDPQTRKRSLFQKKGDPAGKSDDGLALVPSIFHDVCALMGHPPGNPSPATPSPANLTTISVSSPAKNTPTKLSRYLRHAEMNLGVPNALDYEHSLAREGYGPDILADVDNKDLVACGVSPGDALRLKRGAADWWNGPDAKRSKPANAATESPIDNELPIDETVADEEEEIQYNIRFEKRFTEGGCESAFGSGLREGPNLRWKEYTWWYFNQITRRLERVPYGFVPELAPRFLDPDHDAPLFIPSSQDEPEPNPDQIV